MLRIFTVVSDVFGTDSKSFNSATEFATSKPLYVVRRYRSSACRWTGVRISVVHLPSALVSDRYNTTQRLDLQVHCSYSAAQTTSLGWKTLLIVCYVNDDSCNSTFTDDAIFPKSCSDPIFSKMLSGKRKRSSATAILLVAVETFSCAVS